MIGKIHSIETLGLLDGPGIRVVIFMQGCPLRCAFCHNPDTWNIKGGTDFTSDELVKFILKYKSYFENNGGVTFSGGEPLVQKEFLTETLKLCKNNGIHTCIDTAGSIIDCEEVLKYTDLVIFDIKAITKEKYKEITDCNIDNSLKFLDLCQQMNKKIWLRQVIIPGINDTKEYIEKLAKFIRPITNVEKIELLPYHTKAIYKYKELNLDYKLLNTPDMDVKKCEELNNYLIRLLK